MTTNTETETMTAEWALREICELLDLYPVSTPQQVVDKVLFLRSDYDALEYQNIVLRAELAALKFEQAPGRVDPATTSAKGGEADRRSPSVPNGGDSGNYVTR